MTQDELNALMRLKAEEFLHKMIDAMPKIPISIQSYRPWPAQPSDCGCRGVIHTCSTIN